MDREAFYNLVAHALDCPRDTLSPDSRLGVHPGWDSFGHLNIMMDLERVAGIEINDETIRRFSTLAEILTLATDA